MTLNVDSPFDDDEDFLAAGDPQGSAQAAALLASVNNPAAAIPEVPTQPDTFFQLPGSQEFVEVRELTGRDEESVDRARRSPEPLLMVQKIVEAGLLAIGGKRPTDEVLDNMIVGDREYLLAVIREATYGEEIDLGSDLCRGCGEQVHLTIDVKDIPIRRLNTPGDASFVVPLRKGGEAEVHLPTVADQRAALANPQITSAERNTILLTKCIDIITFADGNKTMVAGFPSVIKNDLGLADRRAILKAIEERMPGPQYNEVVVDHEECGHGIRAEVEMMSLFPGL